MNSRSPEALIRPIVRQLRPYVPGEQPKLRGLIKLNTNENPYPPAPKVLAAVRAAVDTRLRLYPSPTAERLVGRLARLHRCRPENIIVGNGSDELLALAVRCFVEPLARAPRTRRPSRAVVQFFTPSYSLYPVLAASHGAAINPVPLEPGFTLPDVPGLRRIGKWDFKAALTFITTPNAPSGAGYSSAQLETLCRMQNGVVVLDEAYADFARENALALALKLPQVIVARTFSKAFSLCFQRVGYCVGHVDLISALHKIRDSYSVNGLGQIAALTTLGELPYYWANIRQIRATRDRLAQKLTDLGFQVVPSQTNFLLARPPVFSAEEWLARLRQHKILVRWFDQPNVRDYLRITVGTEEEADALLAAAKKVLG